MIRLPFRSFAVLVLVVLLGLWPAAPAWAEPTPAQPAGSGTVADPYLIGTLAELSWIAASDAMVATPNRAARWAAHYRQTASIDASDTATWDGNAGWTPIGDGINMIAFTGSYDGDSHAISKLTINRSANNQGLFGYIDGGATIQNLGVTSVHISGQLTTGALVARNHGTILNAYATGAVIGTNYVGGLVGNNYATVTNSFAACSVNGAFFVGGLVGILNGPVNNSYATGAVTGTQNIGGLVGYNSNTITNSYATGSVTGSTSVGGLVGYNASGTVTNSFWDTQTSGRATSAGGTGKTTAEMKTQSTFTDVGWDFATTPVWQMSSSITLGGYPTLAWAQSHATEPPQDGGVYQVASLAHLVWIAEESGRWANAYQQTADIQASITRSWNGGQGWTPIGNESVKFTGSYDGDGHTIDGLFINRPSHSIQGLFGYATGATISNLGATHVDFTVDSVAGGLVGLNEGTLRNCFATGSLAGTAHLGGLLGSNGDFSGTNVGIVENCHARVKVSGTEWRAGGLVGHNRTGSSISNCFASGDVIRKSGTELEFGAFGGDNWGTIENSYSVGNVYYENSTDPTDKGFLGAVTGSPTNTNNFFDNEASNQSTATGATGKTTAEMQTIVTFSAAAWPIVLGWSTFSPPNTIWGICPGANSGYPFLLWQYGTNPCIWPHYMAKANGNWSDFATVWFTNTTGGIDPATYTTQASEAPTAANAAGIIVNANVAVDGNVEIDQAMVNAGATLTVNDGVTLTVADGDGTDIAIPGTLSLAGDATAYCLGSFDATGGAVTFTGTGELWLNGEVINLGTLTPAQGTVGFIGSTSQTITGTNTFFNLIVDKDNPTDSVNATGSTLAVTSGLAINSGVFTSASDLHDVIISPIGTLALAGDSTVSGEWQNLLGTFIHNNHTVTLDGTDQSIFGNTTFFNLTKTVTTADTLTFEDGSTTTILGALTLQGAENERLALRSSSSGIPWNIDPQGTRLIQYVDVEDSTNTNATAINAGQGSVNSGNAVNWWFYSSVSTQAATDVGLTTAIFNGTIDYLGYPMPTYGVCWNTTGDPTRDDDCEEVGTASTTGPFTVSLTDLSKGQTYYVRTYATNALGTVYGDTVTFTTTAPGGYYLIPNPNGNPIIIYLE